MSTSTPVLTIIEHTRVREALHVVERAAKHVARRFARFVAPEDLLAVGTIELYAAAKSFDPSYNHAFADYALRRVRCAMIKTVGAELYQDRIRRSVDIATEQFWAYLTDRDYDASKHDENEARRRFRAIANGMLGAAFMAGVEEAQRATPESETAEREEYEVAVRALREALQKLSDADHRILVALYRDLMSLREVSVALGIPYGTLKRRHAAALERLRHHLMASGVTSAPEPRARSEPGVLLPFRRGG